MDNQYVTRAEANLFARVADVRETRNYVDRLLRPVEATAIQNSSRLVNIHNDIEAINDAVGSVIGTGQIFSEELSDLRRQIGEIKDAIIEIQDWLRRLGLEDMGQCIGDIDTLFR